ncbi:HNH endonuclease [Moraxella caviae]|uniref:HNH endonuclease n=1 Tax=Moraxella caviae TaxID=34060 RepID=A0A1S9ZUU3_9GAMM|nr:HNH endonuclease [Moraxella caviae]OOR87229.1 HNH endonuclease [Moraxella caviae]STZ14011.1 Uncharacterised protein [Moraxella caviae]STZ14477.1 Uncharacterised protein [Moraxella caviae]VEW12853.1 Uncharacterised protein [Moraxella caviae]
MAIITPTNPEQNLLKDLKIWRRDSKKYGQTALYDLLSGLNQYIGKMQKALDNEGKKVQEGFTISPADAAFSAYIRKRANYCCERCGKQYEPNSNSLQCSHHFSRRYHNIRYDPDNALALCYHCHVFWYQKDVPEAARWLEDKIGKDKIDRLIALKNQPQKKPTQSELDTITEKYKAMT